MEDYSRVDSGSQLEIDSSEAFVFKIGYLAAIGHLGSPTFCDLPARVTTGAVSLAVSLMGEVALYLCAFQRFSGTAFTGR
jgi:hypothetical protein